jgi:hypothetical protein
MNISFAMSGFPDQIDGVVAWKRGRAWLSPTRQRVRSGAAERAGRRVSDGSGCVRGIGQADQVRAVQNGGRAEPEP